MGTLVMFVAASTAFAGGVLRWPWLVIPAAAALWTVGYFAHKPQVAERMAAGGGGVGTVASVVALQAVVCAVLFGAGRLLAGLV